ncbi:axin-1 isoform X2 [Neocloeon triangulifer]|uniref:axin-1 isoform X2 n=1 Tax=Neocloeon triangulifer TaxID=2078957 RepID=UPI00286F9879|nr:axin-1 isoform X2 [Neocloeon triangulifer]
MSHHAPPATTAGARVLVASTTTTTSTMVLQSATFDENSPRPPVLGREHEPTGSCRMPPLPPRSGDGGIPRYSPSFTPRKSSALNSSFLEATFARLSEAPMGFEPEGSERATPSSFIELGTPPYLRWAVSLASLLEDPDGVALFKSYLEQEGSTDMLEFWFACEGLKNEVRDDANVAQLVRLIHKRYFKAATPIKVNEGLRKEVHRKVREVSKGEMPPDRRLFDDAQKQVEIFINDTAYPEFLRSETYLQHVRSMQSRIMMVGGSEEECSSSSSSNGKELAAPVGLLPTLHEDSELEVTSHHHHSHHRHHHHQSESEGVLPLTRDSLKFTEVKRAVDLQPKPEAYASDGSYYRSARKQHHLHNKQMRESASYNKDPQMHTTIIPRTQRIPRENLQPLKPDDFARILIEKLEHVQRAQELQEKLERKLMEDECGGEEMVANSDFTNSRLFADFRERLQVSDKATPSTPPLDRLNFPDDNQSILDMHVSRVWSDLTPSRSPGLVSPRPRSPESCRRRGNHPPAFNPVMGGMQSLQTSAHPASQAFSGATARSFQGRLVHGTARHGRKEKDGVSTLSADSGNVHDYVEVTEHKHYLTKSKSVPDYNDPQSVDPYAAQSHSSRMCSKDSLSCKTGTTRKTLTDLSDSGVSVVSETPSCQIKDSRVLSWLIQNETKQVVSSAGYSHSDSSSKHRGRPSGAAGTSGSNTQRQTRSSKKPIGGNGSRSGSQERGLVSSVLPPLNVGAWSNAPNQPFVADPSMPPLPSPNTATQLEEARRRLEDVKGKTVSRQRHGTSISGKSLAPMSLPLSPSTDPSGGSGHSTLKKHPSSSSTSTLGRAPSEYTTVMFTFCDEDVPYRTKINNKQVTLKHFKELLPKKGNYRYFFKTECEDVDTKVIHEEVMEDNEIVPLWEGKVMAQVKPVE